MAKKITHISDISGKDITSHVEVHIRKPGFGIKIGNNTYFGNTVLDLDEDELKDFMKDVIFVESLPFVPSPPPAEAKLAKAEFHGPGIDKLPSVKKVGPVALQRPPDASGYVEHP